MLRKYFFNTNLNPVWSKIQNVRSVHVLGTPHIENCSKYSGSTTHTCMRVEPPLHRTASKVHLFLLKYAVKFFRKSYSGLFFELFTFFFDLPVLYKWQCWYQVKPKQWRTVGVAELIIASILERDIFELTSCPEWKG